MAIASIAPLEEPCASLDKASGKVIVGIMWTTKGKTMTSQLRQMTAEEYASWQKHPDAGVTLDESTGTVYAFEHDNRDGRRLVAVAQMTKEDTKAVADKWAAAFALVGETRKPWNGEDF